jgi:hypothetical protein
MKDNTSKEIGKLGDRQFGKNTRVIVDSDNDSPTGTIMGYCIVLEDVTGFSATDVYLEGEATYPTEFAAGFEFPDGLKDISVTTGKILCIYR